MHIPAIRAVLACCLALSVVAGAGCRRSPAAREANFIARGKNLLEAKEYARAALEFTNATAINAKRAETWHQLGLAYLGSGRGREAVMAFRRALDIEPTHTAALLQLSALMVQSRDPEVLQAAIKRLDQVVSTQANEPEALDLLAMAEFKLNQPEEAEKHLRQALERFPGRLKSSSALAALQFSRKDFAGAEKTLQNVTAQAPKSVDAALALAQLYALERKLPEAEVEVRRALGIEPESSSAWSALAAIQISQGKPDDAEQSYKKLATLPKSPFPDAHATYLLRRGKTDEAIAEFERLVKAAPDDRLARLRLVTANAAVGRDGAALTALADILKKNAKDTDALLLRSRIHLSGGKTQAAEADIQQVLHFQPDSADAHYGLARVYAATGRAQLSEKELAEVVRLRPTGLAARLELARMQRAQRHADAALQTLDAAPQGQKNEVATVVERNWALLALGRTDEARSAIAAGLKSRTSPDLLLQRGVLKQIGKDYSGAREDAAAALDKSPQNQAALNLLMETYAAQKHTAPAVEALRARIAAAPQSAGTQMVAGQWFARFGKRDEARAAFEAAAASGHGPAHLALAALEVSGGNVEAAKTRLSGLLAKDANNTAALLTLAGIEYTAKDYTAALKHFRAAAELRPDNVEALNGTAYLLAGADPDDALKYAEKALELAPDSPGVQDTAGWIYYRKGLYPKAVQYLESAVAKEPTNVRQFHLAMAYIKSGDTAKGTQLLNSVVAKEPSLLKTEQGW